MEQHNSYLQIPEPELLVSAHLYIDINSKKNRLNLNAYTSISYSECARKLPFVSAHGQRRSSMRRTETNALSQSKDDGMQDPSKQAHALIDALAFRISEPTLTLRTKTDTGGNAGAACTWSRLSECKMFRRMFRFILPINASAEVFLGIWVSRFVIGKICGSLIV